MGLDELLLKWHRKEARENDLQKYKIARSQKVK